MLRNLFALLFVVAVVAISSCKEEIIIEQPIEDTKIFVDVSHLDTIAYVKQMVGFTLPTSEEILAARSSSSKLKSATLINADEKSLGVYIFSADTSEYYLYENEENKTIAVRPLVYYELLDGYRQEFLTANQEFPVKNGKIDADNYSIRCVFACPEHSRYFTLKDWNYVTQISYYLEFKDKSVSKFSYFGDGFNGSIVLPHILGASWKCFVTKQYEDGFRKEYSTGLIDYDGPHILDLQYQLKQPNMVATVKVNASLLKGANIIQLVGIDPETGENLYMPYLVDENSSSEMNYYDAPFDIIAVFVCKKNQGCWWYDTKIIGIQGDVSIYELKENG